MKTRFLWMILKISLPSGRHRERRKLNHFDKFLYFLPQRVAIEKRQKLRGKWKYLFYPSRGRAQKAGFYALFSKFFIFGSESEPSSRCLIYEAPNRSHFSSVASKLMPFLITSSLIPSGKGHFLSSFQKNIRSLNPRLEVVLSTYPARISPIIPYSNFCGWKTTRFMKKFPTPLYRNFRSRKTTYFPKLFQKMFSPLYRTFLSQKRKHFYKKLFQPSTTHFQAKNGHAFQKKFPTPIPHVFSGESKHLFQKNFLYYCYRDIWGRKLNTNSEKSIKSSACLVFRSRRYIFSGIQL